MGDDFESALARLAAARNPADRSNALGTALAHAEAMVRRVLVVAYPAIETDAVRLRVIAEAVERLAQARSLWGRHDA